MPYDVVPKNTAKTAHIAWADVATGSVSVGSAITVNNGTTRERAIRFFVKFGRRSGTAFTAGWPNIRFEATPTDSGDGDWMPLYSYQPAVGASIANTTLNGAISSVPATSFVVASATNIAAGDLLFIKGNTDAENEAVRVKSVSGTTINLDDGTPIVAAKNTGNAVTDQAELATFAFGLETLRRFRAVIDNANSGQSIAVEVSYTLHDSDYIS